MRKDKVSDTGKKSNEKGKGKKSKKDDKTKARGKHKKTKDEPDDEEEPAGSADAKKKTPKDEEVDHLIFSLPCSCLQSSPRSLDVKFLKEYVRA